MNEIRCKCGQLLFTIKDNKPEPVGNIKAKKTTYMTMGKDEMEVACECPMCKQVVYLDFSR